jgi:hypothetical protein
MDVDQDESLMDASLETTETYVQKIEANRRKIETKMETCLEKTTVGIIGARED